MQRNRTRAGCDGFTLIEVLAALAIASVIIMASAALIHNVALFFDRGTRSVTEAERLMLAVERLAGDFSSARFVSRRTEQGTAAAAFAGEPAGIVFIGAGRAASGSLDDDLISLGSSRTVKSAVWSDVGRPGLDRARASRMSRRKIRSF